MRADIKKAGLPYTDEAGTCDFHALRVTYATMLAKAGVSLAQAQRLMRHSDPKLTAMVYTKLRPRSPRCPSIGCVPSSSRRSRSPPGR